MSCKLCQGKNPDCDCNSVVEMTKKIHCCIYTSEDKLFLVAPESLMHVFVHMANENKISRDDAEKFMVDCLHKFYESDEENG